MRLLLVEDDEMIADGVLTALRQEGYAVDWLRDGVTADGALRTSHFDAVLLDLGLPKRDGVAVLRDLRNRGDTTAVLVVTARDEISQRVTGLDAGADDYLVKPFDLEELLARVRSLLRRNSGRSALAIELHGVRLDPVEHTVSRDGEPIAVSAKEFAVLEALLHRPGAVLSRQQLEERIYSWNDGVGSNAVEVYVHSLRRKLGATFIRTIRGVGYCVAK